MKFSKSAVSAIVGCLILVFHVGLTLYLFTFFESIATSEVAVAQISIPITLAYAVTIVKWLIDNQGQVKKVPKVGIPYVFGLSTVVLGFIAAIIMGLWKYTDGGSAEFLNNYFALVDGALGALLILFMGDLFSSEGERARRRAATPKPDGK